MADSRTREHTNLAGEHALTDRGQLVLLVVFLGVWITDSVFFHYSVFLVEYVPPIIRLPAALLLLGVSAFLALTAHRLVFGEETHAGALITSGVFSVVRHPMYAGSTLFFCALVIATLSLASAAVAVLIAAFYIYVARYEEKLLLAAFGAEYRSYQTRVPMLLPVRCRKHPREGTDDRK